MDIFPTAVARWNEPAGYVYSRRKPFGAAFAAVFIAFVVIMVLRSERTSWWMLAVFLILAVGFSVVPWIHHRWPKLFPLSGPRVTLYKDRIARQGGKSQTYIALDNIASCVYWTEKDAEAEYWVLRFEPKRTGFGTSLSGRSRRRLDVGAQGALFGGKRSRNDHVVVNAGAVASIDASRAPPSGRWRLPVLGRFARLRGKAFRPLLRPPSLGTATATTAGARRALMA